MFNNCNNLIKIDLTSFNTQNVTEMSNMFKGCECGSLIRIKSKNFTKNKHKLKLPNSKLTIIEI